MKDSDLREKDQRLKHVEEERDSLRLEIERRSREIGKNVALSLPSSHESQ